jgi:polysaccharide chain length determinant protein (PEP-CTERM system associated)
VPVFLEDRRTFSGDKNGLTRMNDVFVQIFSYAAGIWRRRWYMLAVAWLVCGAGWTAVASLPDRYESSARIYVDMDTMLGPLMKGLAVEMNLFQQIDIMRRTLLSRPNLEKVILMTDLDLTVKTDEDKERLINAMGAKINVLQQGRNLFQISYEDTERELTKRVVQAVMQIFVEGNLGASRKDMETTRRFLEGQIRSYERQLVDAEARLAKFKRENMGLLPGEGNYYTHMQEMRGKLSETEAQIGEATMIRDELRSQLADVPKFLEVAKEGNAGSLAGSTGPESDLQLRILEMQQVIDSLLTRYTEQHPDVQSAQRRLAAL